jgi:hypothetical protein
MNPFGTPKAEIREAIAILERARDLQDPQARQEHARQAIPALGDSRFARKLAQVVERFVEDDELDRAIELLQKLLKGDGGGGRAASGRSPRQVLVRVGAGLVIPLVIVGIFFAVSMSGGDKAEALLSLEGCRESQRALGTPIGVRQLAMPPGVDSNNNSELARRALPVKGSGGSGRYRYLAEKTGGAWTIRHGALEMDDRYLMVVPCGGSVSESDAEGRLNTGYSGTGSVRNVEGPAPVRDGEACTVEVHPDPNFPGTVTFNCRVVVTCGGRAVYGASPDTGYVFCSARDGAPAMAVDSTGTAGERGGDPMLRLNLPGGEILLSDDPGWSFTIDLERSHGS